MLLLLGLFKLASGMAGELGKTVLNLLTPTKIVLRALNIRFLVNMYVCASIKVSCNRIDYADFIFQAFISLGFCIKKFSFRI